MNAPTFIQIPVRHFEIDPENKAHVAKLVRMAESKFKLSAKRWEYGQNSGDSETMERANAASDRLGEEGAAMLAPLGIKCSWPGLYPVYEVNGYTEYTALGAVLTALKKPRNWMRPEDCK